MHITGEQKGFLKPGAVREAFATGQLTRGGALTTLPTLPTLPVAITDAFAVATERPQLVRGALPTLLSYPLWAKVPGNGEEND